MFQTILEKSYYEIIEKKSKFIANLINIESKEEAERKIKELKKFYHDARHNCIAYRVFENGKIYEKSSDDGEPSGTAGAPMLNILQKSNLCNILVVVTRYFGGILLGTGGLVKCYSEATIGSIEMAKKANVVLGTEFEVELEYNYLENFKYYCKKNNIEIINIMYSEKIICNIEIENKDKIKFLEDIEKRAINILNNTVIQEKWIIKKIT